MNSTSLLERLREPYGGQNRYTADLMNKRGKKGKYINIKKSSIGIYSVEIYIGI